MGRLSGSMWAVVIATGSYAATGNYSFAQEGRYQILAGESPYNNGRNGVWPLFKLDRWTGEMWTCRWDWSNSQSPLVRCTPLTAVKGYPPIVIDNSSKSPQFQMQLIAGKNNGTPTVMRYNMNTGNGVVLCAWSLYHACQTGTGPE
jgi:hypothetical protein